MSIASATRLSISLSSMFLAALASPGTEKMEIVTSGSEETGKGKDKRGEKGKRESMKHTC